MKLLEQLPGSTATGPLDPDEIYTRFVEWTESRGLQLYPAQDEAIMELASGANVILATPTGSGKSLVAIAAHFEAMARGQRSYYTLRSRLWCRKSSSPSARSLVPKTLA